MHSFARPSILLAVALLIMSTGAACADVEVNSRLDTVTLNDGVEIKGIILMMSPSGVVVVVTDSKNPEKKNQQTIARDAIRSIVIGERSARTEELLVDISLAKKVVVGAGPRKDDSGDMAITDENGGGKKRPSSSKKSASKKKEPDEAENLADAKDATLAVAAVQGAKPPAPETIKPEVPVELPPPALPSKELIETYFNRFPGLRGPALDVANEQRLQEWMETSRLPIQSILSAYVGTTSDTTKPGFQIKSALPARSGRYGQTDAAEPAK